MACGGHLKPWAPIEGGGGLSLHIYAMSPPRWAPWSSNRLDSDSNNSEAQLDSTLRASFKHHFYTWKVEIKLLTLHIQVDFQARSVGSMEDWFSHIMTSISHCLDERLTWIYVLNRRPSSSTSWGPVLGGREVLFHIYICWFCMRFEVSYKNYWTCSRVRRLDSSHTQLPFPGDSVNHHL